MKRIQKKNFYDYEWKKNPNAIYIGRPSKWGNPCKMVTEEDREGILRAYRNYLKLLLSKNPNFLEPLRGKDLVCFCPLDQKCHGDIIIEYFEKGRI